MANNNSPKSLQEEVPNDTARQQDKEELGVTGRRKVIDRRESTDPSRSIDNERRNKIDRRTKPGSSSDNKHDSHHPSPQTESSSKTEDRSEHQLASMRRLLATCERINTANYHSLVMEGFPTNYEIVQAQRLRDAFVVAGSLFLCVFIVGASGLINAWISAIGAGLSSLCYLLALTPLQSIFTSRQSLSELKGRQRQLVMNALHHVRYLEGKDGLLWRCSPLGEYNSQLYNNQFARMLEMSKAGSLANVMRSKNHFRLYLMYTLEAQKAYQRLQKAYLNYHFSNIENNTPGNSPLA